MPRANFYEGTKVCSRKNCIHKGKPQPITNFYTDKRASDGFHSECVDCGEGDAANYKKPPEVAQRDRERDRKRAAENMATADGKIALARTSLASRLIAQQPMVNRTAELADELIRQSGGVSVLARDYLRLMADPDLRPQHRIKMYDRLFTVFRDNDSMNPTKDETQMTDEELDERVRAILREELNRDAIDVEVIEHDGH